MTTKAQAIRGVLFIGAGVWRVGLVTGGACRMVALSWADDADLNAQIAAARAALVEGGCGAGPIALAVDGSQCLCATISTQELARGGRRKAMYYRLEEHLPVAAEQIVADFLDTGSGEAMSVCSEAEPLRAVIDGLESSGIEVGMISPSALLAAGHAVADQPDVDCVSVAGRGAGLNVIAMRSGRPSQWWWFPEGDEGAALALAQWSGSQPHAAKLVRIGPAISGAGTAAIEAATVHVHQMEMTADEAAALTADRILDGTERAWIDLRRDALAAPTKIEKYRGPLMRLVGATAAMLVAIVAVSLWRGQQYEGVRKELVEQQAQVFREAMPGQRVPVAIRSRLQSEHRRLRGLGGMGGEGSGSVVREPSALEQFYYVISAFPTDVTFRVTDVAISPELIRIEGQARDHVEAERVAVALRQAGRFETEAPRTQALRDQGVSFAFTAKPRETQAKAVTP
jgi:hypothetical protein